MTTPEQITAAARALADHNADVCNVNREDNWMFYGDSFRESAEIALRAAEGTLADAAAIAEREIERLLQSVPYPRPTMAIDDMLDLADDREDMLESIQAYADIRTRIVLAARAALATTEATDAIAPTEGEAFEPVISNALHPDTAKLVRRFARALANKLLVAQRKYGYSNNWLRDDWMDECRAELRRHIEKGDPRDVAAYCAFLWHHDASTRVTIEAPMTDSVSEPVYQRRKAGLLAWHDCSYEEYSEVKARIGWNVRELYVACHRQGSETAAPTTDAIAPTEGATFDEPSFPSPDVQYDARYGGEVIRYHSDEQIIRYAEDCVSAARAALSAPSPEAAKAHPASEPKALTAEQRKRIAGIVHTDCTLIPGATFYNAAEMAIEATIAALLADRGSEQS
jgi:hypothetical protein